MKTRLAVLASVAALSLAGTALAQVPRGAAVATLGTNKVTIDYGRPALKGRTIDALLKQLPPERIWRAGENEVSTFSTEADVKVGGKAVKAGKYSLYIHVPVSGKWALVLNSDLGQPLGAIWKEAPENLKSMPYPYLGGLRAEDQGQGGPAGGPQARQVGDAGRELHHLVRAEGYGRDHDPGLGRPGLVHGHHAGEVTRAAGRRASS